MINHQSKIQNRKSKIQNRKSKILLVDDEPFNIDLLEQELEDLELEILTAANGQEALNRVGEHIPDMIFLDLMMPVLDGFGVLEELQSNPNWRDIPVVIVSASSDMHNIARGIELGAVDFLPKPFEPAILHARLNSGLEKKRLHDLEQQYLRSLERELEIGREIQAGFLPSEIPQPEGWHIDAYFQAAREVAGDFYDVFEIAPGQLGLMLGDVTDKGVGSALYMALIRSLLRAMVMADTFVDADQLANCISIEECLLRAVKLVNNYICLIHNSAMYATLFFGVLNTESGELNYLSAGHDPPYIVGEGQVLESIMPTGPAVGMFEGAPYEIASKILNSGDSLVIYSDGVTDAQNNQGELFGKEHFRNLLKMPSKTSSEIFNSVLLDLEQHLDGTNQYDDISLLMVSRDNKK